MNISCINYIFKSVLISKDVYCCKKEKLDIHLPYGSGDHNRIFFTLNNISNNKLKME